MKHGGRSSKSKVSVQSVLGVLAIITLLFFTAGLAVASHGKKQEMKTGILLVAFGSSEQSAQVSFENIDRKIKAAYPDIPVKWAFTSHIIRKKLAAQGKKLDSPEVALARMMDEGFTHVAVQSLHTIGGAEYHDLVKVVEAFRTMGGFQSIILGAPMMASQEDMERTVEAIMSTIPTERKKEEAVVLMGHGTHHPSNAFYTALAYRLQLQDPNVYVGTVEGYPDLDLVLSFLKKNNVKKAYLMPFMSVAGDHAKNDMAGDEEDSWKTIITKTGVECVPILKGTAEYDMFVDIWVDHLNGPLAHFQQ